MSDPSRAPDASAGHDAGADRPLRADEQQVLLRACYEQYSTRLFEATRASLDLASDLFETTSEVPDGAVAEFVNKRSDWIERFERSVAATFERRLKGERRRGRRPDSDASAASLAMLSPFDQEKQAALVAATAFLHGFTKREQAALDGRVDMLLPATAGEIDNPFGPAYLLDAMGSTSRAVYPNPRVWRPLMERVLADITPTVNKIYISINRLLADQGVLPELKAALRARSEWRPHDDSELLPTFTRMLSEVGTLPTDIVVPPASGAAGAAIASHGLRDIVSPSGENSESAVAPGTLPQAGPAFAPTPAILAGLAALAELGARTGAPHAAGEDGEFPNLDPMMALGTSTPLFATLGQWQRLDLPAAIAQAMPPPPAGSAATAVPQNLVRHIRAAVTEQVANPTDRIAMDVIALLFDYIFRDPSIPERQRRLFGRLQVPIVKAALLDRTFFSDRAHAARKLLDHLAEAAIGATSDEAYGEAFEATAQRIVDDVCRDFEIDVAVFETADTALQAFIDGERREALPAFNDNVAQALASEEGEADRAHVRAVVRDRLAGLDVPFDVRAFVETIWSEYLTSLVAASGADSEPWRRALATLDDLLWSIVVKDRTAQRAKLTKMVPTLVAGLRRGCTAVAVEDERSKPFFEALYRLHMAAIKPAVITARPAIAAGAHAAPSGAHAAPSGAHAAPSGAHAAPSGARAAPLAAQASLSTTTAANAPLVANVHDFVTEMAVGTWLAFGTGAAAVNARLSWVSPLRSKYVFTSRSRTQAFVFSPEDLAWELGSGRASLVVEPVPLFDRAVSAALDTLAAARPPEKTALSAA
jgi:hypothetical protein